MRCWIAVAMLLPVVLVGCARTPGVVPLTADACPEESTLYGIPPTVSKPSKPTEATQSEAWAMYCGRSEAPADRHGPYRSWYSNGQVELDGVFEDGAILTYTRNDRWGRAVAQQGPSGGVQRTWWHADGTRAVSGTRLGPGGMADGEWSEWDESGEPIRTLTFDNGSPTSTTADRTILLYANDNPLSLPQTDALALPSTTSPHAPSPGLLLVLEREQIVLDGVPVLALEERAVAKEDLRGQLIDDLYDALLDRAEGAEDQVDGPLLVMADREHRWSLLLQVIYTAGQARFPPAMFVGRVEDVQWPPRTGPAWQQGEHPLAVVPIHSSASGASRDGPKPPSVVILIDPSELVVEVSYYDGTPAASSAVPCRGSCFGDGGLDLGALHEVLLPIKQAAPEVTQVGLYPSQETPLSTLIHLMDGVSRVDGEELFPSVWFGGGHR